MCDPTGGALTLAALALSAGGQYYNARTQANAVNEQNRQDRIAADMSRRQREAELARQEGLRKQATGVFEASLDKLRPETQQTQEDQNIAEYLSRFEAGKTPFLQDGMYLSGQENADPAAKTEIFKEAAKRSTMTRDQVQAMAKLAAMGATAGQNQIFMQGQGDKFGTLGSFMRGSQGVSNMEQNIIPAQVTPGSTTLGDIMTLGGNLLAVGSGAGAFKGGIGPFKDFSIAGAA